MLAIPLEVVPDAEDPRQALPYIQLSINGTTVRALLDSGAARTSIAAPADTPTRPADETGTGAFGQEYRDRLWRASLTIQDTAIGTFDIADATAEGQFNVGQDVLSRLCCHYRLTDRELIFDPSQHPDDGESIYLDPAHHVYVEVCWPGVRAQGVFDTGASVTVIDESFAARHPELLTPRSSSTGTDASGVAQETPMVDVEGPKILGHAFTSSPAAIVDLSAANATIDRPMDLILGWPLISQVDWMIDHQAARAQVIARSHRPA